MSNSTNGTSNSTSGTGSHGDLNDVANLLIAIHTFDAVKCWLMFGMSRLSRMLAQQSMRDEESRCSALCWCPGFVRDGSFALLPIYEALAFLRGCTQMVREGTTPDPHPGHPSSTCYARTCYA